MLKYLILLIFSFSLISCNENIVDVDPPIASPISGEDGLSNADLQYWVSQFELMYGVSINFTVMLDEGTYTGSQGSGGTTIGVCRIYASGRREVFLSKRWFESTTTVGQQVIVFHELGHCQFNRAHDNRIFSNGMPMSIMYPVINPILTFFAQNDLYYLTELEENKVSSSPVITYGITDDHHCIEEAGYE